MSNSKTYRLEVNDIFDELKDENKKLYEKLLIAEKCHKLLIKFRNNLNYFYNCCKCGQNCLNEIVFNQLIDEYKCVFNQFEDNQQNITPFDVKSDNNLTNVSINEQFIETMVKTEEYDEEWDQSNDFDSESHESESEDESDKPLMRTSNERIDNSNHIKSYCNSAFSVIKRKSKNYSNLKRIVCNFNGCDFECMTTTKMERHIETHSYKNPINCEECEQIFWSKQQLTKHIKDVHKDLFDKKTQKFICNYNGCHNRFKKLKQLLIHKKRHSGEKHFNCSKDFPECEWSFYTSSELRNHQIWSHSDGMPHYICDSVGCGQTFVMKTAFDLHKLQEHKDLKTDLQLIESPKDSFNTYIPNPSLIRSGFNSNYSMARHRNTKRMVRYICNYIYCDFKCSVKDKMERHVKQLHFNKSPIDCCECDDKFWTPKLLTNHIRPNHSQLYDKTTQKFKCTYNECNLSFDRYSKLQIHRKRHLEEKSFKCSDRFPNCKWTFFTIGELKNHEMWSHNNEYPFVCDWDGCDKRFKLKNLLVDHKLYSHSPEEMPFRCEWPGCDYRCVRQTTLKVHTSSHVGLRDFVCDWPECGQTFRTKSNLSTHFAIHTNKRKFTCDWPGCEYRCITSTSLRRHKIKHKAEGDYLCDWPQCFKRFKAKFSLLIHTRAHRGDKPFKCLATDCDMRFTEKKQMTKHFRRKHSQN